MTNHGPLPVPDLIWRDGTPAAAGYDDIYFNPEDGVAETRHVFLSGTGLPERWKDRAHFTIGELGFGTGLNFLCAWELWNRSRPARGHLHFVSIEGSPLLPDQLASAHEPFPEFQKLAARLRAAYPSRARGHHLLPLADDVTLHLLFGEAKDMLAGLEARIDAWFLDGFAPSKNPEMWTSTIIADVARCSAPGARLATFTVAGDVRRALQAGGFDVNKSPGFGRKREMLQAEFNGPAPTDPVPWFAMPPRRDPGRIAIVGGGLAGISCARALVRQGCTVTLLDEGAGMGAGASGTPSGLVMPRLGAEADAAARFYAAAHRLAVSTYRNAEAYSCGGALHLPPRSDQTARLARTLQTGLYDAARATQVSAKDASARAGTRVDAPAIYFTDGGQLDTAAYFADAVGGFSLRPGAAVAIIEPVDEGWRLSAQDGTAIMEADTVIIACAMAAKKILPAAALPLEARHGQITRARGGNLPLPVAFGGYAAPAEGGLWIGATHTPVPDGARPRFEPTANEKNLTALAKVMPDFAGALRVEDHWCGIRATTPDRLPMAGPVVATSALQKAFAPLAKGNQDLSPLSADEHQGLYAVVGLGSRGFVSAPLLGEVLASQILGTPSPIDRGARHMLHPARFAVRALKRGTTVA